MKDLVNKTINLAKLNSDKIEFNMESIPLSEEIDYIIKNNQIILEDSQIEVINETGKDLVVEADRIQLQELLNNLITNAIKYAFTDNDEGCIEIILKTIKNNYIFTIADNGIGSEKNLENLNENNLGMKVVHALTKQLEGTIEINSSNGLRIDLTFPTNPSY